MSTVSGGGNRRPGISGRSPSRAGRSRTPRRRPARRWEEDLAPDVRRERAEEEQHQSDGSRKAEKTLHVGLLAAAAHEATPVIGAAVVERRPGWKVRMPRRFAESHVTRQSSTLFPPRMALDHGGRAAWRCG